MRFNSIADIYATADTVRKDTIELADSISAEESAVLADGATWTLRSVFEHMSLVDDQILWVVEKLVAKAEKATNGDALPPLAISSGFSATLSEFASSKLTAPDRVLPSGDIPIPDSVRRLEDSLLGLIGLRERIEKADLSQHHIPHPYLGNLTAPEWMVIRNGHEMRHVAQARAILGKIR
ncbi:MAG TPA: DinB family protein [Pyrinomonadaceae bacterium]|nr:DinB family protein [Pyrinomonadaceae bacterium]